MCCPCDNISVVEVLNNGYSRNVTLMHLLWRQSTSQGKRRYQQMHSHVIICRLFSNGARGRPAASTDHQRGIEIAGQRTAILDIPKSDRVICHLYYTGLAPATQKAYLADKKRYLDFCKRSELQPVPVAEGNLCRFVAFLQVERLYYSTEKSYLSAVRHLQISQGLGDPRMGIMPKQELVVRGPKREQAVYAPSTDYPCHTQTSALPPEG